jgi:hypothetical protein
MDLNQLPPNATPYKVTFRDVAYSTGNFQLNFAINPISPYTLPDKEYELTIFKVTQFRLRITVKDIPIHHNPLSTNTFGKFLDTKDTIIALFLRH